MIPEYAWALFGALRVVLYLMRRNSIALSTWSFRKSLIHFPH